MSAKPAQRLGAALDKLCTAGSWLVLPLALLLCAQWPLRDLVAAGSREANDLAQLLFAFYVALAVRTTTRDRAHLAADTFAQRYPERVRARIARWGHALAVLPFALFVLVSGWPMVWRSLRGLEAFPETFSPGYFIIKIAALLLALLMVLQALVDAAGSGASEPP